MSETTQRIYEVKHVYIKDLSFESPKTPEYFAKQAQASDVKLDVNTQFRVLNEERTLFDVALMLRVVAISEEETIFLVELNQACLVEIAGFSDADVETLLNIAVPNVILPYARETISSLVGKGGFPPLYLRNINFDRIYAQKLKADQEKKQSQATEH